MKKYRDILPLTEEPVAYMVGSNSRWVSAVDLGAMGAGRTNVTGLSISSNKNDAVLVPFKVAEALVKYMKGMGAVRIYEIEVKESLYLPDAFGGHGGAGPNVYGKTNTYTDLAKGD